MIRILHIVTYMGRGGLETMLMNYYRQMPRNQIQFDFLVHRSFEADYDREILSMGGRIYHFPRLIPWSLVYRKKLEAFFRKHPEYKIIHVHQDCLSAIALKCAKKCCIPVRIAHSHNSSQDKNWKYLIKCYYRHQIPLFATDLLACSGQAGEWMFGDHPFIVLPNAIDGNAYAYRPEMEQQVRAKLEISDTACVIGHVGRFYPQKNHVFLVDIFYEYFKRHPTSVLLLVGDGPDHLKIQNRIERLGIVDNVRMVGVKQDVAKFLQAMDVFVFPSLYEGLGISVIEAQAAGIPCLISDTLPKESIVAKQLVIPYSLKKVPEQWAAKIEILSKIRKTIQKDQIRRAGYDLTENALGLKNYYFKKASEGR